MSKNAVCAKILSETKQGERIVSCGGRISTQLGTALELYGGATDKEKNLKLINRVVASGHKTILEHHYFNIAFNNVSVFVEQYLIEFRLAAFTIKSGRYVNFSDAGFNLPSGFSQNQKKEIKNHYKNMFNLYKKFVDAGIPVEDARFVLPYGIKTNIYMSLNARELIHVICTMVYGRGKEYEEIYRLGLELKEQFDKRYPGLVERSAKDYASQGDTKPARPCEKVEFVHHKCKLISCPSGASLALEKIAKDTKMGNFDVDFTFKNDKFAKILEHLNYTFYVKDFALIILKHYTRHRMQSLSTMPLSEMAQSSRFIIPPSIAASSSLKKDFINAIKENRALYNSMIGVDKNLLIYLTPHAAAIDFVSTMNARELLHFMNLRSCNRAQWTIRDLAVDMLTLIRKKDPALFSKFGPSCFTSGICPEGRLCCGKQAEVKQKVEAL